MSRRRFLLKKGGVGLASVLAVCCLIGAEPNVDRRAEWKAKYLRPAAVPFPVDNAYSEARQQLGKVLFFDPRLSGSQSTSCASCHNPGFAWGDALPKGVGHKMNQLGRRTPTILNVAWADLLFWDGRAQTLEEQALGPISSEAEMAQPLAALIDELSGIAEYRTLFDRAYPGEPIAGATIAKAIATYERTIVSGLSPFDKWIAGDEGAISEKAKRGFDLFNGRANCSKCHDGWNFTDNGFHDIGTADEDRGRGALIPVASMQYSFKTPTLRSCDRRGPFMHDGSEPSLERVVTFYNGGGKAKRPSLAPEVLPLNLSESERSELLSFLGTLTGGEKPTEVPVLPR